MPSGKTVGDMKIKVFRSFIVIILLAAMGVPLAASAVSYTPPLYRLRGIVYMFHSGTDEIKKTIHSNDILVVYRIESSCGLKEIGKVRVVSYIGETYLKGEIIEGDIRPDDIAKKGGISCLIIAEPACIH